MRRILCSAASSAVILPAAVKAAAAPAGNDFSEVTYALANSQGLDTLLAAIKVGAQNGRLLCSGTTQPGCAGARQLASAPAPWGLPAAGWAAASTWKELHPTRLPDSAQLPPRRCAQAVKLGAAIKAAPQQTFFAPNGECVHALHSARSGGADRQWWAPGLDPSSSSLVRPRLIYIYAACLPPPCPPLARADAAFSSAIKALKTTRAKLLADKALLTKVG